MGRSQLSSTVQYCVCKTSVESGTVEIHLGVVGLGVRYQVLTRLHLFVL